MPTILASIISGAWPLVLAAAVFVIGYGQGQDKAKADYAAAEAKRIYYADKNAQAASIQYIDRIRYVKDKQIAKKITHSDRVMLPADYRVQHDAAAQPDAPAGAANAAPIAAAAFADTVSNNYATCHDNAAKLTALQDWARSLHRGAE